MVRIHFPPAKSLLRTLNLSIRLNWNEIASLRSAIRRDPSAIERGTHLLARYRWQVKGQRNIVVHNSLPLLDRCAASATGIMPHIHVSGYFRLTVPVNEVIE